MAKALTPQQRKFKAAVNVCRAKNPGWPKKAFGQCMRAELGGRKSSRKRRRK